MVNWGWGCCHADMLYCFWPDNSNCDLMLIIIETGSFTGSFSTVWQSHSQLASRAWKFHIGREKLSSPCPFMGTPTPSQCELIVHEGTPIGHHAVLCGTCLFDRSSCCVFQKVHHSSFRITRERDVSQSKPQNECMMRRTMLTPILYL